MPNPYNNFFNKGAHGLTFGNEFCHQMMEMIEYSIISSYPQMMTFDEDQNLLKNSLKPDFKGSEKVQIGCSGLTTDKLRTPSKLTIVFWELKD